DGGAPEEGTTRRYRVTFTLSAPLGLVAECSCERIAIAVAAAKGAGVGGTQSRRGFDQCIEHGLQLELGTTDDLEDLASRGLVFERLCQFARARLHLIEQTHV